VIEGTGMSQDCDISKIFSLDGQRKKGAGWALKQAGNCLARLKYRHAADFSVHERVTRAKSVDSLGGR
jgi:hypothetical protein